jgi:hypothetical protein
MERKRFALSRMDDPHRIQQESVELRISPLRFAPVVMTKLFVGGTSRMHGQMRLKSASPPSRQKRARYGPSLGSRWGQV